MSEKTTGELLARRVIAGCATRDERVRMATLYLEMAAAYKIEMCLPKDFELRGKFKKLLKKLKRLKKRTKRADTQRDGFVNELGVALLERNMLWSHASDRVDWNDGEADMSRLADKLEKMVGANA